MNSIVRLGMSNSLEVGVNRTFFVENPVYF